MISPAEDALDKRFDLRLSPPGKVIVKETVREWELSVLRFSFSLPGPWLITIDRKRTPIGRVRNASGAEQAQPDIPPGLFKLSRAEADGHFVRIVKDGVIVAVNVARIRSRLSPSGRVGFKRMPLKHPVAGVNQVDVLLHNDVAGEHSVVNPVAKRRLVRRGMAPPRTLDIGVRWRR